MKCCIERTASGSVPSWGSIIMVRGFFVSVTVQAEKDSVGCSMASLKRIIEGLELG
jgi:hypothetical protein